MWERHGTGAGTGESVVGEFSSLLSTIPSLPRNPDHLEADLAPEMRASRHRAALLQGETEALIRWPHGGSEVSVGGTFTGWELIPMNRCTTNPSVFTAAFGRVRRGDQYKFVVDGVWQVDPLQPTETDDTGNINNVIRESRAVNILMPMDIDPTLRDMALVSRPSWFFDHLASADVDSELDKSRFGTAMDLYSGTDEGCSSSLETMKVMVESRRYGTIEMVVNPCITLHTLMLMLEHKLYVDFGVDICQPVFRVLVEPKSGSRVDFSRTLDSYFPSSGLGEDSPVYLRLVENSLPSEFQAFEIQGDVESSFVEYFSHFESIANVQQALRRRLGCADLSVSVPQKAVQLQDVKHGGILTVRSPSSRCKMHGGLSFLNPRRNSLSSSISSSSSSSPLLSSSSLQELHHPPS